VERSEVGIDGSKVVDDVEDKSSVIEVLLIRISVLVAMPGGRLDGSSWTG